MFTANVLLYGFLFLVGMAIGAVILYLVYKKASKDAMDTFDAEASEEDQSK